MSMCLAQISKLFSVGKVHTQSLVRLYGCRIHKQAECWRQGLLPSP